mgnify:CR=1 FL=1
MQPPVDAGKHGYQYRYLVKAARRRDYTHPRVGVMLEVLPVKNNPTRNSILGNQNQRCQTSQRRILDDSQDPHPF